MRVAVVSAEGPASPSLRVRTVLPAAELERHGVSLEHRLLFSHEQAARFAGDGLAGKVAVAAAARRGAVTEGLDGFDCVLVHRRADPFPTLVRERRARRAPRMVYDVDDAIWLDRSDGRSHRLAALKGSARKARWLAERSDHVIAGNSILAEHLSRYSGAVTVVPSLIDPGRIEVRSHADAPELVVGWIGSRSTAPFVARLRPALERVADALGGVGLRLVLVGGSTAPIPGVEVESRLWSPKAQADALRRMDVGVMPLPDTPWNRGKCAYKALQYMAAGVPVVADDVGVAGEVVGPGGVVVRAGERWPEPLAALLRDAALRRRLGSEGRRRVERDYSVARWAPELAAVIAGR